MEHFRSSRSLNGLLALLMLFSTGCQSGATQWWYLGKENPDQEHYTNVVSEIDYPNVVQAQPQEVESTSPPRTIISEQKDEIWDLPLQEAIHLAMANNDIIRSSGQFLNPNNTLLANPNNANSIYDPAIQASGVLFGGVSVEAALADFDANWTTSMFWGRNETIQNSPFGGGVNGSALEQETANFTTALSKQFAYGAQLSVSHDVNYQGTNSPNVLFPSVYTGNVEAEYRQQLLAGAGPEFVRVAGPLSPTFAAIAGVSNGVLIARINQDISITNFEANIRNLVKDVEDTYWDLYLAYRNFDTAVTARNTALYTWRNAKFTMAAGGKQGFTLQDEAQARDRYFETRAQAENALGNLYVTEQTLRNLLGLPVNDRKIIRPADSPLAARVHADWYHCLAEALTERVELRRQKWNVKSLELQLGAAENFARPRLDFVSRYRVNGFGDNLLTYTDNDVAGGDLNSMYEKMTEGDETGWDLGLELSMPIGLRVAKTQVRNLELRLTKARKVLAAQELEISHELAVAFQELERTYATAVSNYARRQAAMDRFRIESALIEGGAGSIDMNLRAQESLATAANSYHQSLVDYNKALVNLYFRKGTLLQEDNIHLMEGQWDPEAYRQAYARAKARANAIPAPHLRTMPEPFAADGMIPSYGFSAPEASGNSIDTELAPVPETVPLPMPNAEPNQIEAEPIEKQPLPSAPGEKPAIQPLPAPGQSPPEVKYFENKSTSTSLPELFGEVPLLPPAPIPQANSSPIREASGTILEMPAAPVVPASDGLPLESEGWQLRKEGWGLNELIEEPFPVSPVGYWKTEPKPATPGTRGVAGEIGRAVPEYR